MNLLFLERVILESLLNHKTLFSIARDTGLKIHIIQNIFKSLEKKKLINFNNFHITPNIDEIKNNVQPLHSDIKELVSYIVEDNLNKRSSKSFGLRKVWFSPTDEMFFNHQVEQIGHFLKQCQKSNKDGLLKEKKIIFWGTSQYQDVIGQYTQH